MQSIEINSASSRPGHPWVGLEQLPAVPESIADGEAVCLFDKSGHGLGCGLFDRKDGHAVWRRYTLAEAIAFDEHYVATALIESIERRADESCQRLVHSDADFLPGLVVELYGDIAAVWLETPAVRAHERVIAEVVKEVVAPAEIVIHRGDGWRTFSGQGLKARWIEVDDLFYRIDILNTEKPRFFCDQREQHALVGSLCEGRSMLDLFSHSGAFALHAMRSGGKRAVAVESEGHYAKAIGANAQRNGIAIEVVAGDALRYLEEAGPGVFDAIVCDPPAGYLRTGDRGCELHERSFAQLAPGGLLATYSRERGQVEFEAGVAEAAARAGREARIFARTSQPFDFPLLLNFPESQQVQGLILQVE